MIPFLDLHKLNARFETAFKERFQDVLDSGYFILGNHVKTFESQFAAYCGTKHCIGTGNGLDALRLILEGYKLLGKLAEGDEVLVASNTYIATIIAIKQAGLVPILVEADLTTYNFDIDALETSITLKTKGIMPVHLYGQLSPMKAIHKVALANDLLVVEDAAQAHGAEQRDGKRAGNLGHAAGFSFYPSKNLGALGDGGAVTTNDDDLAQALRKLRNYGTTTKYINEVLGINSRLDEVQAAFMSCKLPTLDADNKRRREIALRYVSEITSNHVLLPSFDGSGNHVFHLFVVRVIDRTQFVEYLTENAIGSLIHYPVPPHHQNALKEFNSLSFPVSEMIHEQVVSIPMSPVMTDDEVSEVVRVLNAYQGTSL